MIVSVYDIDITFIYIINNSYMTNPSKSIPVKSNDVAYLGLISFSLLDKCSVFIFRVI